MALVLSDGQLAASASAIVGAGTGDLYVAVTLFNTSGSVTETVSVTNTRSGSTARTIARAVLGPYESLYIRGLPLDPTDSLQGVATHASTVDYLVTRDRDDSDFFVFSRAADGSPKTTSTLSVDVAANPYPDFGQEQMLDRLDQMLDELRRLQ